MIKSKNRIKKTIVGMITFVLAFFLLPLQGVFAAPQEIKDDTDLSALRLYQFQLTTDNMSVISKSSAVDQYHMNNPIYEGSPRVGTPMENFTLKVDKTKKADQTFDKPLSLKFTNAGTVNGKQVDAYLTINKVTLHYINNSEATAQMANASKTAVQFFNVSNTWGANQFEIGNIDYLDATHNYFLRNTFTVDADVTVELKYSDGSEPDMKLVMKPTDIDANGQWNTKEAFYVTNYSTSVDKQVMNNRNILQVTQEGDKTVWNAGPGATSGSDAENNISGLALRSVNNTMNFGYRSANYASATFSLYMEQVQLAPEKEVDPAQIPAQAGEAVTYKTLFRIPKPGKEIITALSSLDFVDTFDDRLDFKNLTVDADGVVLTEGTDYTVEKSGQKVTVKMAAAYLNKDKAGTPIRITYNTVTNNKVGDKASGPIENIVAMQPDNLYFVSNKVTTTLLYNKIHEFVSGTPGKELPQEVKDLLPATDKNLSNGSQVTPTQPSQTEVKTAEGTWSFKSYDKASETINGADVKFTGTWEFTPAPTVRPITSFVDTKGNTLIPSEDGEQPKKEIPGYRFVETKKLPNGDTEHVYEKVKTSFKDKEGNEIPGNPSEDGEQPKKDIPGYRFVETKKLPNGDTEHVYEKVKTSHKDKDGNEIPNYPTEDGEQPKKDIPGYRFVETKKLPNGDTVHVYEKIIPSVEPEPAKPSKPAKELPNTGTENHSSLAVLGILGILSGFGLVERKKKED